MRNGRSFSKENCAVPQVTAAALQTKHNPEAGQYQLK